MLVLREFIVDASVNPKDFHSHIPSPKYSLVGADTSGFEGLGAQLFVLVGDHVDAEREFVNVRTLSAEIEDTFMNALVA